MRVIAACNSNLHGDTLWSVAPVRVLAHNLGAKVDFWITWRAGQLRDLLLAQDFVRDVIVEHDSLYTEGGLWGGHHDNIPYDRTHLLKAYARKEELGYSGVYELHMRHEGGRTLLAWFCKLLEIPGASHHFDLPPGIPKCELPPAPFVVMAMKPSHLEWGGYSWTVALRDMASRLDVPVVEVGPLNFPTVATDLGSIDLRSPGFLEMTGIISKCAVFVGTMSAPLVIADAMPHVHRISVVDNRDWDWHACTTSGMNHYCHLPTGIGLAHTVKALIAKGGRP